MLIVEQDARDRVDRRKQPFGGHSCKQSEKSDSKQPSIAAEPTAHHTTLTCVQHAARRCFGALISRPDCPLRPSLARAYKIAMWFRRRQAELFCREEPFVHSGRSVVVQVLDSMNVWCPRQRPTVTTEGRSLGARSSQSQRRLEIGDGNGSTGGPRGRVPEGVAQINRVRAGTRAATFGVDERRRRASSFNSAARMAGSVRPCQQTRLAPRH